MPEIKRSCDCRLVECGDLDSGEVGAFFYEWDGLGREFPKDVVAVVINMPVTWEEANKDCDWEESKKPVSVGWHVRHDRNFLVRNTWTLSGTNEKPTLSPSLHWVGIWHGFLENGHLRSC
jgi:hypothetical protein